MQTDCHLLCASLLLGRPAWRASRTLADTQGSSQRRPPTRQLVSVLSMEAPQQRESAALVEGPCRQHLRAAPRLESVANDGPGAGRQGASGGARQHPSQRPSPAPLPRLQQQAAARAAWQSWQSIGSGLPAGPRACARPPRERPTTAHQGKPARLAPATPAAGALGWRWGCGQVGHGT